MTSVEDAIADDLNGPRALAVMWNVVGDRSLQAATALELIQSFDSILGLNLMSNPSTIAEEIPQDVIALVEAREQARQARDWGTSDRLRSEISTRGYEVVDSTKGPRITKASRRK